MNALSLLCQIIAQGGKVPAAFHRDDAAFAPLVRHGFLREAGVVGSLVCSECDAPHAAPVVFEDGDYGYYCSDCGFIPLERYAIKAVQPDQPILIKLLADTFDCQRRKASALHGETWRIGSIETDGGAVSVYFHPRLKGEEDARDLDQALAHEVRSDWRLIVTANGTLPIVGARSVQLDDLVELDVKRGTLQILSQPADLAGVPRKNAGGAPNRFRNLLSELSKQRMETGASMPGRNVEARALLSDFKKKHPDIAPPSLSTVNNHVTKSRGGE